MTAGRGGAGGPSTAARVVAALLVLLAVAAVAYLLFAGGGGYHVKAVFLNAGQLVNGNQVQAGGVAIGSVENVDVTQDGQAEVTLEIDDDDYKPLRRGTRLLIRPNSLSGIANRFVDVQVGPDAGQEIPDGGRIGPDDTQTAVELDEVFSLFDRRTRRATQDFIAGQAEALRGRGRELQAGVRYLDPALSTGSRLFGELTRDNKLLRDFLVDSSALVTALGERREDLTGVVRNLGRTFGALGSQQAALSESIERLPPFLRRANTTFVNLRATLDDLDVLVDVSKPATKDLAPFLRELRPLIAAARPTVHDLRTLVSLDGPNNDLVDATRKLPRLAQVAGPAFRNGRRALEKAQPVLEFARPYTPDLVGWLRDFGQGAANYDANGHFARIQPMFDAFSFTDNPAGGVLRPVPPGDRFDGYQTGVLKRCPGAATQRPADNSAPFTDGGALDCDPTLVLPGP
jgi:phospholipid/cholesterol/gamma-HCH transport system substrate-binding protein